LKFQKNLFNDEQLKKIENNKEIILLQDEKTKLETEVNLFKNKIQKMLNREETIKSNEKNLILNLNKIKNESEILLKKFSNDKNNYNQLQHDFKNICNEISNKKLELEKIEKNILNSTVQFENLKNEYDHYLKTKTELNVEINRLENVNKMELKRIESFENSKISIENNLNFLKSEISKHEKLYDHLKKKTKKEEEKISQQKQILLETVQEKNKIEKNLVATHNEIFEEKKIFLVELSSLEQAKQNLKNDLFSIDETNKKIKHKNLQQQQYLNNNNNTNNNENNKFIEKNILSLNKNNLSINNANNEIKSNAYFNSINNNNKNKKNIDSYDSFNNNNNFDKNSFYLTENKKHNIKTKINIKNDDIKTHEESDDELKLKKIENILNLNSHNVLDFNFSDEKKNDFFENYHDFYNDNNYNANNNNNKFKNNYYKNNGDEVELDELQKELEKLKLQTNFVLKNTENF
jgi:hypothetical protein